MATIRFGDTTPLRPHTGSRLKKMATSPAPGDYDVQGKEETKFKRYPASQFGGRMCGVDRERTGIRASALQHMDDPGPHSYSAAAGQQKLKVQPRSQTTKFGSSDRSSTCRLYIHKNDVSGNDTHPNRLSAGRDVPGPGTYEILEAWTRSRSDRNFTFGIKTSRTQENITATTERIGPGAYHQPSSFGPQLLSKRPTTPGFSIGGSTQGEVQKIRERQSRQSPGPTEYDAPTGIGKQQFVSTKPTASSFSFGSTSKLQRPKSRIPGPAKYEFTSMLGLQSISQHRSYGGFKFGTSRRPDTASQLAQTSDTVPVMSGQQNDGEEDGSHSPTMWGVNYFAPLPTAGTANKAKRRSLLGQWASAAKLMRKYKLGEVLGKGADAKVLRATRRFDGTMYAIKVIEMKHISEGQSFDGKRIGANADRIAMLARAARIQRELEIHLKLPRHPHIVPCYEVFSGAKRSQLVLGLCEGGTLLDSVCGGSGMLEEPTAAHIARQVLEAVRFLHVHGVVHRDLKLENLLLLHAPAEGRGFHVQLSDFGSARYLKNGGALSTEHLLEREATAHVGTLAYMAPEQHTGGTADAALDMWSFGIVLAALCTGRHPLRDIPKDRWHAEMQRDRLPDGASKAAAAAWATLPEARDLARAVLRLESSDRITAVQALKHEWIVKYAGQLEETISLPQDRQGRRSYSPKKKKKKKRFGFFGTRRSSPAPSKIPPTSALKNESSVQLSLRDDGMRVSQVLARLRDVQRTKLERIVSVLVAMLAPDASALIMFEELKGEERNYLLRDDIEGLLVDDGVPLRAVDELCETFVELSLDYSAKVFEAEFVAGVLSLRPKSRLKKHIEQVFAKLGDERSKNQLAVEALGAARRDGCGFIPDDDELHFLLDTADISSSESVVDLVAAIVD